MLSVIVSIIGLIFVILGIYLKTTYINKYNKIKEENKVLKEVNKSLLSQLKIYSQILMYYEKFKL